MLLRKLVICFVCSLLTTSAFAADTPWGKCHDFSSFVESSRADRVAYSTGKAVVVLDEKGKVLSTIQLQKGWKPAFIGKDGALHFYRPGKTGSIANDGKVTDDVEPEIITTIGETPISSGEGQYLTVNAPGLSLGMHTGRFSGVAVKRDGTSIAQVQCSLYTACIRLAKYVEDHWTWLDEVPTAGTTEDYSAVLLLPGWNDVRFLDEKRIAFLAQMKDPRQALKNVTDLTAVPINAEAKGHAVGPIYLLYCKLKTGFCQVKAKFKLVLNGGADYSFWVGAFTVSVDQKWLYIRTGDQIWRLSCKEESN